MKWKFLFPIALFTIAGILSGCRHKVSSVIAVQDTLTMGSVYADKGGTLKWETADSSTGKFQIHFLYYSPCQESDDQLNNDKSPQVVCHVVKDNGTYIYEILPYPGKTGQTPSTEMQNFAQVGGCRGCTKMQGIGGLVPTNTIYIACDSNGKAVAVDSPPSVSLPSVLEWMPLGAAPPDPSPLNGATFQKSPCSGSSAGPYYGPNKTCSVDPTATGNYTYTVSRSDCKQPSDPVSLNVNGQP